ncbi:chromatin remodelling complex Rsc7/Swp82 subunit domain-containing protein [Trichoderma velutinum]
MPLPPPVSGPARQTIKAAFEDLDRTITPADSRDFRDSSLPQVRDAALEIERQLAARGSLRNMRRLMPLFKGIEHYSKVIDVLCNGTPYLPWIWAPIALILRIASEYVDAFERIIKGYSQLAESLGRFELLKNAFIGDSDFQQTLAVFYADILQFHKYAYQFVRRSGWKLIFLTSWGRFQRRFDNILDDMRRHETLIDREANARNIAESKEMRQDIRRWREESLEQVSKLDGEAATKQYQSIVSWLNMDESDQLAIFESTSTEGRKHPGTCSWVLKNRKISSWLQSKLDTPVLWLQGTPGSGKSVISTQLVSFMQSSNMFVIHHFCTYLYASSTTYEQILRSLFMQLLRKDADLVAHVYEEFVLGKKSPTISALERLLQVLFKSISNEPSKAEYVWVILDGLDECELEKQVRVVSLMNQITSDRSSSGNTTCKVLISSRTSSTLSNCLRKKQTISLTDEKICLEEAIRQYASQRLQSLGRKFHQLNISPGEVDNIEREIAKKADGMFLYARLVLDYLSTNIFYSGDEIMTSVNQLPEKLSDFYRKILLQILTHLDNRSESRVKSILSWIAFAKRPLKRLELLSAITFSSRELEVSHLVPEYILDICGPLVEERSDTTLTFIHVSVKEFLQTPSSSLIVTEEESLQEHGLATVSCLLSGLQIFSRAYPEQTRCLRVIKGLHGFHVYATEFWIEYLLSSIKCAGEAHKNSPLFFLACKLADALDKMSGSTTSQEIKSPPNGLDDRTSLLQQHPILYKHVEAALKGRSLKRLEAELFPEIIPNGTCRSLKSLGPMDGISAMLTAYQDTVRSLLDQHDYPGVTAEELELFKNQFRASAFTCRLKSCPRATLGFESEKFRHQHEMTHIRRLRCTVADCKFPPFLSSQALKIHTNKYHGNDLPPKSIRGIQVSPKTLGIPVYQKNPSDTWYNKNLPRKAQESPAKQKLSVRNDEDLSGYKLPSVYLAATEEQRDKVEPPEGSYPYLAEILASDQPQLPTSKSPVEEPSVSTIESLPSPLGAIPTVQPEDEWDKEGDDKVLLNGELTGSREYLCQTFCWVDSGDDLYMLQIDCIRILGDKYRNLLQANCPLPRIFVKSTEGKNYLMSHTSLQYPHSYEEVVIVRAQNVFRQFGHLVIVGGRPVHDDYWVTKAREKLENEITESVESSFTTWLNLTHPPRPAVRKGLLLDFKRYLHRAAKAAGGLENITETQIRGIRVKVEADFQPYGTKV